MEEMRNAHRILVRNREGKRPLGRYRLTVDLIHLAQDMDLWRALVNTVMKLTVSIKSGEFID
jgi:hypothetical protein